MISFVSVYALLIVIYGLLSFIICIMTRDNLNRSFIYIDFINVILIICLVICAFYYRSTTYVDLDRMMDEITAAKVFVVSLLFKLYSFNPISAIILLIGYYSNDYRFLQIYGVLACYGLYFISLALLKRKIQANPFLMTIVSLLYLLGFNSVSAVTNIRYWTAVNLLVLGIVIKECLDKTSVFTLLSVISVLIHAGIIIILLLYLISYFRNRKTNILLCIIFIAYESFSQVFGQLLAKIPNSVVVDLYTKYESYYGGDYCSAKSYDSQMYESGSWHTL